MVGRTGSKVAPGKDHEEEDMRAEIMRESGQLFLQILFTKLVHPKFLQQQLGTETSQAEPRRSVHWQFLRSRAEETVLCDRGGLQGLGSSATVVSYHTRSNYIELWLTKAAEICYNPLAATLLHEIFIVKGTLTPSTPQTFPRGKVSTWQEYFEYTPGVLRAFVKPAHLDSLTFTLQLGHQF